MSNEISYEEFVTAMSNNELSTIAEILIEAHIISNGRMLFFNGMDY